MEKVFIKFYVLISLWLWAGMLLSNPLREAFEEMHWRLIERIYDATWGRVVRWVKTAKLYIENRTQKVRIGIARSLVSKELLQELMQVNLVAAISRARQMDQGDTGVYYDELCDMIHLLNGKPVDINTKESAVKAAFKLCGTCFFEEIIAKAPRAQERILLAFDQMEGKAPYDSVLNPEYRKFIRD